MANYNKDILNALTNIAKKMGTPMSIGGNKVQTNPINIGAAGSGNKDILKVILDLAKVNPTAIGAESAVGAELPTATAEASQPQDLGPEGQVGKLSQTEPQNRNTVMSFEDKQKEIYNKAVESSLKKQAEKDVSELGAETVAQQLEPKNDIEPFKAAQGGAGNAILDVLARLSPNYGVPQQRMASARLADEQAKTYRMQREQGMTAADREKENIDFLKTTAKDQKATFDKRRDELFSSAYEPMTSESVKALNQIESSLNSIDTISNLLDISVDDNNNIIIGNKNALRNKNFLSKNYQSLKRARDVMINKGLRRDSGATIGVEEEKKYSKIYGFDIGMKSFMQNPEVIARSIMESKDQLSRDRSRIIPNEQRNNEIRRLEQMGYSRDDIAALYEKRGEL